MMEHFGIQPDFKSGKDDLQFACFEHLQRGVASVAPASEWSAIGEPGISLVLERRECGKFAEPAEQLLRDAPFVRVASGRPGQASRGLEPLSPLLLEDISDLAHRFAALMNVDEVRIRLEAVTSNACRKIHADVTDLRLITTYYGPATQVLRQNAEPIEENLWAMRPGWVGLFKGRIFGEGHAICLHRSPPAGDLGMRRLVLVIDTPRFPVEGSER